MFGMMSGWLVAAIITGISIGNYWVDHMYPRGCSLAMLTYSSSPTKTWWETLPASICVEDRRPITAQGSNVSWHIKEPHVLQQSDQK